MDVTLVPGHILQSHTTRVQKHWHYQAISRRNININKPMPLSCMIQY